MLNIHNLASRATLIGTLHGIAFYEHPLYGDEAGLIASSGGVHIQTDWGDLPDEDEYPTRRDLLDGLTCYLD